MLANSSDQAAFFPGMHYIFGKNDIRPPKPPSSNQVQDHGIEVMRLLAEEVVSTLASLWVL
jgi:hypothetical protein